MEIESIDHKNLRKFFTTGKAMGLMEVERLRRMLAFVDATGSFDELAIPPNYGFHALTGDRAACFTKVDETTIAHLDLEDCH